MHSLDPGNHLFCEHADCFDGKLAPTKVKHFFERRPKEIHHHDVVQAFLTKIIGIWNANYKTENNERLCAYQKEPTSSPQF